MKEIQFYSQLIAPTKQQYLKLESKRMPLIAVNEDANIIKYVRPGNQNQISAARTSQPLEIHTAVAYFQAQILGIKRKSDIGIGLINKDCALKKHPGASKYSAGYISDGQIYFHRNKIASGATFTKNDRIGVGVDYCQKEIFFTKNGQIIKTKITGIDNINWVQFYPCASVHNQGDQVKLIFKESDFKFDFKSYRQRHQTKMFEQIKQQNYQLSQVYSLVTDYLIFNGYNKTLKELQKAKKTEYKSQFMEHPFYQKKIQLKPNNQSSMQIIDQEQMHEKGGDSDEQIRQTRQCAKRHRIMSDYWGYMVPDQLPRKYTIQQERMLFQSRRKSSIISNQQSNIKEVGQEYNIPQKQMRSLQTVNSFLMYTRIKIIDLIKSQEIEQAMTVLYNSIPKIFTIHQNLQIYFKMHIFLRKIKREGSKQAILYARQVSQQFNKAKGLLFPRYNQKIGKLDFVSFDSMIGLIRYSKDQHKDALSNQQFESFALYINDLMLKSLGYYSQSKLSVMINHMKNLENRSKQHQINGPLFTTKF